MHKQMWDYGDRHPEEGVFGGEALALAGQEGKSYHSHSDIIYSPLSGDPPSFHLGSSLD